MPSCPLGLPIVIGYFALKSCASAMGSLHVFKAARIKGCHLGYICASGFYLCHLSVYLSVS